MAYSFDSVSARTDAEFREFFDPLLEDVVLGTTSRRVPAPYATFADYVREVRALCEELLSEVSDE